MKKTCINNLVWKVLVCSVAFMLGILAYFACAVFSNTELEFSDYAENNSAYAEDVSYSDSPGPEISDDDAAEVIALDYSSDKIVVDVTDGEKWHSKEIVDAADSLYAKLAININFSPYSFYDYTTYWVDSVGGLLVDSAQLEDNPERSSVQMDFPQCSFTLNSNEITVKQILVSGTTWYGENIDNFDILESNGKNVIAGSYSIKKIVFDYDFKIEYLSYRNTNVTNTTPNGGNYQEAIEVKKEKQLAGTLSCDVSGCELFIKTNISFGSTLSQIESNLGVNAVYDSTTQWIDNIVLYDSNVSSSEAASDDKHFYYSFNDGKRKPFEAKYGVSLSLNQTAFGAEANVYTDKNMASFFGLVWYRDKELSQSLSSVDTINAGIYYICIEGLPYVGSEFYYTDSIGKKYSAINFMYNNKQYIQEFNVAKAQLKISIKDEIGVKVNRTDNLICSPFVSSFTEAVLFYEQKDQNMPSGIYYEKNADSSYVATTDNKFSFLKQYYINKSSAKDVFINKVNGSNLALYWDEMGGYENDLEKIMANPTDLLSFAGSYFPGYDIKKYDYAIVFISINIIDIAINYTFDLGEYQEDLWKPYSSGDDSMNKEIMEGMTVSEISVLKQYEYYDNFAITPPEITIDISEFRSSFTSVYYGEIWRASDIDFSKVKLNGMSLTEIDLDGNGKHDDATYDISTSLENWRIRIISSTSERKVVGNYNYIFVLMQIAKKSQLDKKPGDYEDENGIAYTPYTSALYAGEYYITYSLSYMLSNSSVAVNIDSCDLGKSSVNIESGGNSVGVAVVNMNIPSSFIINPVTVYLNLTEYTPTKYYDGTNVVRRTEDSKAVAQAVLKQETESKLSPLLSDYSSVLDYDLKNNIMYNYGIYYSTYLANDYEQELDITGEVTLAPKVSMGTDVFELISSSYNIEPGLRLNDENIRITGYILRRTLELSVLKDPDRITDTSDPNYSSMDYNRGYNSITYVAIRVARYYDLNSEGTSLLELYKKDSSRPVITEGKEYYADYYLLFDQDSFYESYYFYADLPGILGKTCYILTELDGDSAKPNYGFLNDELRKENFGWDSTDSETKLFNESDDGYYYMVETYSFIDWENAYRENDLSGELEKRAYAKNSDAGFYHLSVVGSITILNYNIVLNDEITDETINGNDIGIEITKVVKLPEEVFDIQEEDVDKHRNLVYDKTDKISLVYTSDIEKSFILITRHDEYEAIRQNPEYLQPDGSSNFMSLINVIGFSIGGETEDVSDDRVYDPSEFTRDIYNMRLAGDYILEVSTPETTNYKKVTTTVTIRVYCAEITVYATAAIRTYMSNYDPDNEIKADVSEDGMKFLTSAELENYIAYMDPNTYELYPTNVGGDYTGTYIYYKNDDPTSGLYDTSLIRLYYVGLADGDSFSPETDREAVVTIDTSCFIVDGKYVDQAGKKPGAVILSGAYKQNYRFNYNVGDLYVKRQTLVLDINPSQQVSYDGTNLIPESNVLTEDGLPAPANLTQYIAAYYAKGTDGKYHIFVRDFSSDTVIIKEGIISSGPAESQTGDYYFYFETYFDENGAEVNVEKKGSEIYAVIENVEYKLYANGSLYYYYVDNDREKAKITITREEIYIYNDGAGYYYYDENNLSLTKTYLSENIEPDFEIESDNGREAYIDIVEGRKIYIGINEDDNASILNRNIKNVFYDIYGNKGGYLLKVYASPSESAGGNATNYSRTKTQVVIFSVEILEVDLLEHQSGNYSGTVINPIWDDEFIDDEYALKEFGEYYKGTTLENNDVILPGSWAKLEVAYIDSIPKFSYMYTEEENFADSKLQMFAEYELGLPGDFRAASEGDIIKDAGLYVVLVKATINNAVASEGEDVVNMRNNLRFKNRTSQSKFEGSLYTPDEDYEAYFVLYLVIERSDDINIVVSASNSVVVNSEENGNGYLGTYSKTYDSEELWFKETMRVLGEDSTNGEIINVRAYMSTTPEYINDYSYLYFRSEDGVIVDKWIENAYINLTHVNEFYITFIANFNDTTEAAFEGRNSTYNNNYITYKLVYKVRIDARRLIININTRDPETGAEPDKPEDLSYKFYGMTNESVEDKFFFTFENWAGNDGNILLPLITEMPKIDWEAGGLKTDNDPQGQKKSAGTDYYVKAMEGKEPVSTVMVDGINVYYTDYAFEYSNTLDFEIKKLQLSIGGSYPCVVIDESKPYAGIALTPDIKRYGWDGSDLDIGEDASFTKEVTFIGRINNYDPSRTDYTDADAIRDVAGAINVDYYLFRISIGSSRNYIGIEEPFYWVFAVEKSELILEFVDEYGLVSRGYANMTYTGVEGVYPTFGVKYEGFKGDDDRADNKSTQQIKFRPDTIPDGYCTGISMLGLVNPLFVFVDAETGEELINEDGTTYMPVNAGEYYIKIVISEGQYGYADNYKIVVKYAEEDGKTLYPVLNITKRLVGVSYVAGTNDKISKEYDGTDKVIENSVVPQGTDVAGNYSFSKQSGDTGLVAGDFISLKINYALSRYARKDVYDEYEVMSDIDVYLYVEPVLLGDDAENYQLSMDMSDTFTNEGVTYIRLCGVINPARATVRFLNKQGQIVNILRVTYNGEPQPAIVEVDGVNGEILTVENGDYTVWYKSEKSNWDSDIAPTNCDYYEVIVTITNKNYSESPQTGYLEILQAEVEINFGGEGIQMYGNVTEGLTAVANGVKGYSTVLGVNYYYLTEEGEQGDLVPDISIAPAGTYIAEAIHQETDNFAYKRATEYFTISRRDTTINYDVAPRYKYTGTSVSIRMYFIDNGEEYYPKLIFDKLIEGVWVPDNYTINENGEITSIGANPSSAGEYRVKAYEILENYYITDPVWCNFIIEKAELTIKVNDITVNEGTVYSPTATMVGCLTNEAISSVVSGLQYRYYTTDGDIVDTMPTAPGSYKITAYGGISNNYNLNYTFGILTINKTKLEATDNTSSDTVSVIIEGSFSVNTQINVSKKQNTEYADMNEAFNSFVSNHGEYINNILKDIYVFSYENYIPTTTGGTTSIKLYMPELFAQASNSDGEYYVAVMASDGSVSVVNGRQEGDYLVVETAEPLVKAVSVLREAEEVNDNQYDWLLYVGIAVAVVLIACAIIIVVKKA